MPVDGYLCGVRVFVELEYQLAALVELERIFRQPHSIHLPSQRAKRLHGEIPDSVRRPIPWWKVTETRNLDLITSSQSFIAQIVDFSALNQIVSDNPIVSCESEGAYFWNHSTKSASQRLS